jgi:hypothetical protein
MAALPHTSVSVSYEGIVAHLNPVLVAALALGRKRLLHEAIYTSDITLQVSGAAAIQKGVIDLLHVTSCNGEGVRS